MNTSIINSPTLQLDATQMDLFQQYQQRQQEQVQQVQHLLQHYHQQPQQPHQPQQSSSLVSTPTTEFVQPGFMQHPEVSQVPLQMAPQYQQPIHSETLQVQMQLDDGQNKQTPLSLNQIDSGQPLTYSEAVKMNQSVENQVSEMQKLDVNQKPQVRKISRFQVSHVKEEDNGTKINPSNANDPLNDKQVTSSEQQMLPELPLNSQVVMTTLDNSPDKIDTSANYTNVDTSQPIDQHHYHQQTQNYSHTQMAQSHHEVPQMVLPHIQTQPSIPQNQPIAMTTHQIQQTNQPLVPPQIHAQVPNQMQHHQQIQLQTSHAPPQLQTSHAPSQLQTTMSTQMIGQPQYQQSIQMQQPTQPPQPQQIPQMPQQLPQPQMSQNLAYMSNSQSQQLQHNVTVCLQFYT